MTPAEEFKKYQFKSAEDVVEVLKNNVTIQTLRHFEATSEQERWMVKGAALALKLMRHRHEKAVRIANNSKFNDTQMLSEWAKHKIEVK